MSKLKKKKLCMVKELKSSQFIIISISSIWSDKDKKMNKVI